MRFSKAVQGIKLLDGHILRLDRLQLAVRGGVGGQGLPARGGCGGDGGDVVFRATDSLALSEVSKRFPKGIARAPGGTHSAKLHLYGAKGSDLVIKVPVGVSVLDENKNLLADFNKHGEEYLAAEGGQGARPENGFVGQTPVAKQLRLDLKLVADVGLVGFPNAGKSTLLKALTRARPSIAAYPFTTLRPQVGMLRFDDLRSISIADLPGLIEGASANVGMGCDFLKHVERTLLLLFVIDLNGFQLKQSEPFITASDCLRMLCKELALYDPELVKKPALLCINKVDKEEQREKYEELCSEIFDPPSGITDFKFVETLPISALYGNNIDKLRKSIRDIIDLTADSVSDSASHVPLHVERKKKTKGKKRAVAFL